MDDIKWAMAPVLVATNRARHTITHPRALHLARLKETVVLRWVTDFDNWQNKPKKEHFHDVLQDPCFWEYFVRGASGFITKNISKKLHVVNGQKITYHSVVVDAKWQDWLTNKIHQHTDGTEPIDLPEPPLAVNVELELNDLMNPQTKDALRTIALSVRTAERGSARAKEYVVLPITPKREEWQKDKDGKALNQIPVPGGPGYSPCRVQVRQIFPLQPNLATTVHKAQGNTLDRAIVFMSRNTVASWNFTFEQVHVAFSRVKESQHLRLLLTGETEADKWSSITYINQLKQDPTVRWYFMGFRKRLRPGEGDPNENWMQNEWSADRANRHFLWWLKGYDPYAP